jgi:hypothetical protein
MCGLHGFPTAIGLEFTASRLDVHSLGSSSQADYLERNVATDDSIGGSQGVTGRRVQ